MREQSVALGILWLGLGSRISGVAWDLFARCDGTVASCVSHVV